MIRAWRNIDRVPVEDENQRRWLFIVARRIAIDAARSRRARSAEVGPSHLDTESSVDSSTEAVVAADTLRRAIRSLSPDQRIILNEVYIHGRTMNEVARRLGIPQGTVKSRSFYALQVIRDAVTRPDES
jgi:RNA polymerase sigma-70 factor (ECF subfamily)